MPNSSSQVIAIFSIPISIIWTSLELHLGFPGGTVVKNPHDNVGDVETWVQSLGWEDPWCRKWQHTSVFLPGKSHGQRSLADYSPWSHKESDMTERLSTAEHRASPTEQTDTFMDLCQSDRYKWSQVGFHFVLFFVFYYYDWNWAFFYVVKKHFNFREESSRWGNTCAPVADSCQCMAKTIKIL